MLMKKCENGHSKGVVIRLHTLHIHVHQRLRIDVLFDTLNENRSEAECHEGQENDYPEKWHHGIHNCQEHEPTGPEESRETEHSKHAEASCHAQESQHADKSYTHAEDPSLHDNLFQRRDHQHTVENALLPIFAKEELPLGSSKTQDHLPEREQREHDIGVIRPQNTHRLNTLSCDPFVVGGDRPPNRSVRLDADSGTGGSDAQ